MLGIPKLYTMCYFVINALATRKFTWNSKWILVIDDWGISCEIALIWMSPDFADDQSIVVQVMAW